MHLLTFHVHEPLAGRVLPEMIPQTGAAEAANRYRAIVLTTMRQLRGLADTRIRLNVSPDDAGEAVRFWLLPRLADRWQAEGSVYRSEGWEIDFGDGPGVFASHCVGEILCPDLGGRWVHAALLGLGRTVSRVIGPERTAGDYFRAESALSRDELPERILPRLPVIRSDEDWQQALESAIGSKLRKAWEQETGRPFPD